MGNLKEQGDQLAAQIEANLQGRQSHILIGPARVYDDRVGVMAATGEPDGIIFFDFGEFMADPPDALREAVDCMLILRSGNSVMFDEGQTIRQALIAALRTKFAMVDDYNDELDLAVAYATVFPSAKSRAVLQNLRHERSAN